MAIRTQIIPVTRKPRKCPVCGNEVIDIVYDTGDMEEWEYTAVSEENAAATARSVISKGVLGLDGTLCKSVDVFEEEDE